MSSRLYHFKAPYTWWSHCPQIDKDMYSQQLHEFNQKVEDLLNHGYEIVGFKASDLTKASSTATVHIWLYKKMYTIKLDT